MGEEDNFDKGAYYHILLVQAEKAGYAKVPYHTRTKIGAVDGHVANLKVECPGSYLLPSEVDIREIAGDQLIKGTCADRCAADLTWDMADGKWVVNQQQ